MVLVSAIRFNYTSTEITRFATQISISARLIWPIMTSYFNDVRILSVAFHATYAHTESWVAVLSSIFLLPHYQSSPAHLNFAGHCILTSSSAPDFSKVCCEEVNGI